MAKSKTTRSTMSGKEKADRRKRTSNRKASPLEKRPKKKKGK